MRTSVAAIGLTVMTVAAACGTTGSNSATGSTSPRARDLLGATPSPTSTPMSPSTAAAPACTPGVGASPPAFIPATFPTALAFAPDGRLFWTERGGTLRVWQNGQTRSFAALSTVTTEPGGGYSERGLLGLAISPNFTQDHFVFAMVSDPDRVHERVVRWHDCAGTGTDPTTVVTLPAGGDCCHKGGRITFGTDGRLYVTVGDEHIAQAAQDLADVRGKILRYNPDGTVPTDNPFGRGSPIWAYGLRNPFGIAVAPTGQIAVTINGPSGDAGSPPTGYDTIIVSLARGGAYQWPLCYGYSHPLSGTCGGQVPPDWSSETATVIPTGATFVDGHGPAPYAGHLVVCTYGRGMLVVTPGVPHATVSPGPSQCRLDVTEGPDHALYMADTTGIHRLAG